MFGNALMEVTGGITDIICIAQIPCKFINNALPIYNTRLNFSLVLSNARARDAKLVLSCHGKFDCLVYEMLFIQELKPSLNTQSDSISAKLFL